MIKLESTIRELKNALRQKRNIDDGQVLGGDVGKPYHLIKADEKIEELTRATAVLAKSKDKDQKVLKMQKKLFDKNMQEANVKIQNLEQQLKEKEKEIKV